MSSQTQALIVEVTSLTGLFHGAPDFPPSPFRLFQALVAGAYGGRWATEPAAEKDAAFRWLESLNAPLLSAPPRTELQKVSYFVPNNDLDAVGGDPRRIGDIRALKTVHASLLETDGPFVYAWRFDEGLEHAQAISRLADRLHTLGHGVDAAYASAKVLDWSEVEQKLARIGQKIIRPQESRAGAQDPTCPTIGSLESLKARKNAKETQFAQNAGSSFFSQPPKPLSRTTAYDAPPVRFLFDLRPPDLEDPFHPIPVERAAKLTQKVRTQAATRLKDALPDRASDIELYLARPPSTPLFARKQVQILPIPTIGHEHAEPSIRRLLVEVPPDCPFEAGEISWALAGQTIDESVLLVAAEDTSMLRHYGVDREPASRWQTVTPMLFPFEREKGRLTGGQRMQDERRAAIAVADALRDLDRGARATDVQVQVEPFYGKGSRADAFSTDRTLRHVKIVFSQPICGPLYLGSGVFDGLGLFAPVPHPQFQPEKAQVAIFKIQGPPVERTLEVGHLSRAALMSLAGKVPPIELAGRDEKGPLRAAQDHDHAFYLPSDEDGDGRIDHLFVYCRKGFSRESQDALAKLHRLWGFSLNPRYSKEAPNWTLQLEEITALAGLFEVSLLRTGREWISVTPYFKSRFDKKPPADFAGRVQSYRDQIIREWSIRHPESGVPKVEPLAVGEQFELPNGVRPSAFVRERAGRGGRVSDSQGGFFRLIFPKPVRGPLSLGKHAHFGLGLFAPVRQ